MSRRKRSLSRRQVLKVGGLLGLGTMLGGLYQNFTSVSPGDNQSLSTLRYAPSGRPTFTNMHELVKAKFLCKNRQQVELEGFYRSGDGGGGVFVWNPAGTGHNGGTVIDPFVAVAPGVRGWWNKSHRLGVWERQNSGMISVSCFGVFSSSYSDWTAPLWLIMPAIAEAGLGVYFPPGIYRAKMIRIFNGTTKFVCDGLLRSVGTRDPNGLLQLDGPLFAGGTPVENCYVRANIDMSGGDYAAIVASGCSNCTFEGNKIRGFTESKADAEKAVYKYGIVLRDGSHHNKIIGNKIVGFFNPKGRHMLINLLGNAIDFGGYFDQHGLTTRPTRPSHHNVVMKNLCVNGSYSINVNGSEYNQIALNTFKNPNHRCVYLGPVASYNLVSGNQLSGYKSTAVVMGYGSSHNRIINNNCSDGENPYGPCGEASINLPAGASYNVVENNRIDSQRAYGIYLGVGAQGNIVRFNQVKGYHRAAIAIESDWMAHPPENALYSRSNYAPPLKGRSWAMQDTQLNLIQGNVIGDPKPFRGTAKTCGIYVSQFQGSPYLAKNHHNRIIGNQITSSKLTHYFYVYEQSKDANYGQLFADNTFPDQNSSKIRMPK